METIFPTLIKRRRSDKYIPDELKDQIIEALLHYPVLNDVEIDFRIEENIESGVMRLRPRPITFFTTRKSFIVEISKFIKVNKNIIPIQDLPHDVVVGWLGYELARMVELLNHNRLSLLNQKNGYFLTRKSTVVMERMTNVHAIQSGIAHKANKARKYILKNWGLAMEEQEVRKLSPEDTFARIQSY